MNIYRSTFIATAVFFLFVLNVSVFADDITLTTIDPERIWAPTPDDPNNIYNTYPGNVGIGTANPLTLLHVVGPNVFLESNTDTAFSNNIMFQKSRGTTLARSPVIVGDETGYIHFQGYDGDEYHSTALIVSHVGGTPGNNDMPGRLTFSTTPDGSASLIKRMTITSAGNVGIGTTNPKKKLHITESGLVIDGTSGIETSPEYAPRFIVDSGVSTGHTLMDLRSGPKGAKKHVLWVAGTGHVGIGRRPAANKLEVEGTASKTGAGAWLANSDSRIKTNIKSLEDPLSVIGRLRPVQFHYTEEYKKKHSSLKNHLYYNFIAQEFQRVFPDYVSDNGEGYLQMDSYPVTPYLVAAVQELSRSVEELRRENKILKEQISSSR